jgi:signal transduction histidine kinase
VRLPRLLRTSSFRLTLAYAGLFGASVLILFGVIYWATNIYITRSLDTAIDSDFTELTNSFETGGRRLLVQELESREREMPRGPMHYLLQDRNATSITGDLPPLTCGQHRFDLVLHDRGARDGNQPSMRIRCAPLSDDDMLIVGIDAHSRQEMRELIFRAFGWGSGITLVLAFGGGMLLSSGLLCRIEAISRAARTIMAGDFSRRIPVRGTDDEFDHLVASLNAMLDRIQNSMDSVRQVSTGIAHDLRTPLTRLRQRLERAHLRARSSAEWRAAAADCIAEMDAILETFGALLRIAQIESGATAGQFAEVDLSDLLTTLTEVYEPMADDKKQSFCAQISRDLKVWGDRELLGQMLANIIENAMKHSPPGARIDLKAAASSKIKVIVSDDGPGIPVAEQDNVFKRFYRLASSSSTPGSGLGLSLVDAIANLHHTRVDLADNDPGLRVTLSFSSLASIDLSDSHVAT